MADSGGKTAEELKELGNTAFSSKDFKGAVEYYTKAIQKDPKNHVFFSNRSASYAGLEEWQKACDDAKECIRLDPSFVKGYYRLAAAQIEQQDYDGAFATIRQGLAMDQDNSQLLKQLRSVRNLRKAATAKHKVDHQPQPTQQNAMQSAMQLSGRFDEATQKELQELQQQLTHTNREYQTVQANLMKTQREFKIAEVTKNEVDQLPDATTRCYRSVGKMFLLSNRDACKNYLEKQMEEHVKRESDCKSKMEYLERRSKATRQNIEELVQNAQVQTLG